MDQKAVRAAKDRRGLCPQRRRCLKIGFLGDKKKLSAVRATVLPINRAASVSFGEIALFGFVIGLRLIEKTHVLNFTLVYQPQRPHLGFLFQLHPINDFLARGVARYQLLHHQPDDTDIIDVEGHLQRIESVLQICPRNELLMSFHDSRVRGGLGLVVDEQFLVEL